MEIPSSSSSSKKTGDFAKKFEPSNFWCFKEKGALPRAVDQFAKFFGVSRGCSCKEDFSLRRMQMCERRFGPLKQEAVERCKQCLSAKIRASQREESDGAEQDMLDSKYPPIHDALYVKKASVLSLTFREIKATGRKIQDFFRSPPYRSSDQTFDYTDAPKVTCKNVVPHTSSVFPTEKSGFFGFKKKRSIGVGAILNVIDSDLKPMKSLDKYMIHQIISLEDYRPYFTYWITSVQFFILLISLFLYSFAPISFGTVQVESFVLKPSLALEHVGYVEPGNLWIGPASAKLILLGAKYTPCMRGDKRISRLLNAAKAKENESACCIRNDGAGCIQTSREDCSSFMSTWHSWSHDLGDHDALYKFRSNEFSVGSVCGQHPKFCANPLSNPAKPWPNDLARWPVCKEDFKKGKSFAYPNMNCDLIGRPCCVGIKGECLITTQKYCDFVKGSFHREATLCSQVSCLNEVCGLLPFLDQNTPDQIYRLAVSLFIHAGILHFAFTLLFQMIFMADMEKLIGPARTALIYFASGISGNLASATFLPYRAEVGPGASQFGIFACMFVEIVQNWKIFKNPLNVLAKMSCLSLFFFATGFLPWIDNFAHVFGFATGFLCSFVFVPYISPYGPAGTEYKRKLRTLLLSILAFFFIDFALLILFYFVPFDHIRAFEVFNCLPFHERFCSNYDIIIND